MLWPSAEASQELYGQEVQKAFEEAAHAVLRAPETPGSMMNLNLAHAKAARRGHDRDKAVQLPIQPHLAEDQGPIALHAAVVIVQPHSRQSTHHEVENSARPDLVPGIVAFAFPTADDVESLFQSG